MLKVAVISDWSAVLPPRNCCTRRDLEGRWNLPGPTTDTPTGQESMTQDLGMNVYKVLA